MRTISNIVRVLLLLAFVPTGFAADAGLQEATSLYESKNYVGALQAFRPLAEKGNSAAQYALGRMYSDGQGVEANRAEAIRWYQMAAEQGHVLSQSALAGIYHYGPIRDLAQAKRWYEKAAAQGHITSMLRLGELTEREDPKTALKWFYLAAENGLPSAWPHISRYYATRSGAEYDRQLVFMWSSLAARINKGIEQDAARMAALLGPQQADELRSAALECEKLRFRDCMRPGMLRPTTAQTAPPSPVVGSQDAGKVFLDALAANRSGDHARAVVLLRPLVEHGDGRAQNAIAGMFLEGQGVNKSRIAALMWYLLADDRGHSGAKLAAQLLAQQMDPRDVRSALGLGTQCRSNSFKECAGW